MQLISVLKLTQKYSLIDKILWDKLLKPQLGLQQLTFSPTVISKFVQADGDVVLSKLINIGNFLYNGLHAHNPVIPWFIYQINQTL